MRYRITYTCDHDPPPPQPPVPKPGTPVWFDWHRGTRGTMIQPTEGWRYMLYADQGWSCPGDGLGRPVRTWGFPSGETVRRRT